MEEKENAKNKNYFYEKLKPQQTYLENTKKADVSSLKHTLKEMLNFISVRQY